MRHYLILFITVGCISSAMAGEVSQTWDELHAKRQGLTSFHQTFDVTRSFKTAQKTQSSTWSTTIDFARERWRERSVSGAGDHSRVFDGEELYQFEEGSDEFIRVKRSSKEELPQPGAYATADLDFRKGIERGHSPCGLPNLDHECITLEIAIKPWVRNLTQGARKMMGGSRVLIFDQVTGLLIASRTVENIDDPHGGYQQEVSYKLKRMSYNNPVDETQFRRPASVTKQVKELSRWNAEKIRRQLGGKAAPEFALTDLGGNPITLGALKGKTVLLDFWATWCGPCRADAPAIDKLYQKYHDKNLAVIGISVDEERPVVQKFLSEHPHKYPIVLTTENEMPRAYQIGVFPTYVVIDTEGNVTAATEGDKGFAELRHLLKKAGLDTD